jgi:hypothetical protein
VSADVSTLRESLALWEDRASRCEQAYATASGRARKLKYQAWKAAEERVDAFRAQIATADAEWPCLSATSNGGVWHSEECEEHDNDAVRARIEAL